MNWTTTAVPTRTRIFPTPVTICVTAACGAILLSSRPAAAQDVTALLGSLDSSALRVAGTDRSGSMLSLPGQPGEVTIRAVAQTPPKPGGSTLPAPAGGTVVPAAAEGGSSAAAIAHAEGLEIAQVRVVGLRVIPIDPVLQLATYIRPGAAFAARQAELDRAKIAGMGFFASVQYQVTPNIEDPKKVDIAFVVAENRVVNGFKTEGASALKPDEILKMVQSKTGAVLNSNTLNGDIGRIHDLYKQRGYAALVTDAKQGEDGVVTLTIQEARVSRVAFSGLRKTHESLVRKLTRTKPGEPFDQKRVQLDMNRLYDTGFFDDVTYNLEDDAEKPGHLIVTIGVKEKRTGTFSLGVGFDSRSKISGFLTLSESNFQGSGKRLSGSVEVGSQRAFDISYGNPFIGPKNASANYSIYNRRIFREPRSVNLITGLPDTAFYEERRQGGRSDFTLPLDKDRNSSLLIGYRNEKANLFVTDLNGTVTPLPGTSTGRISAPSIGFVSDKRDLRLDPSKGQRISVILESAVKFLGGDNTFTKVDVDLRKYIPLKPGAKKGDLPKMVLAGRVVIGKSFGQLPAFEQYFVGGSDTVRGYDTDEQFGDNQIFGNVELRYRMQRKFQVVGFVDAGSSYGGTFSSSGSFKSLLGFGGGIRVQTPIGPIRLDIGHGSSGIRTHFGIGSSF